MRRIFAVLNILILATFAAASAQLADKAEVQTIKEDYAGLKAVGKPFSLIDLSRVAWSHSYSVSFFSGGGASGSIGFYTGAMFYEISPSLSIDLALGIAHNPGSLFNRDISTDAALYPSARLDYHPSEHFRLSIGFNSYPGIYYNPYMRSGGLYNRYFSR